MGNWKYVDKTARKDALRVRFVLALGGIIIGYGVVADPYWLDIEDHIQFGHTFHPDHEGLVVERHVQDLISDYVINIMMTNARR